MIDADFMRKHFTLVHVPARPAKPELDPDTRAWVLESLETAAALLRADTRQTHRNAGADLACALIELKGTL